MSDHTTMHDDVVALAERNLGTTGLTVTSVTLGTTAIGRPDLSESVAAAVLAAGLTGRIHTLDTSNNYGDGRSEHRIGEALARQGGLPAGRLVVTKVDPRAGSEDFSGERVRASVAESMERLGLDHLPLVHLHDPERITFEAAMAPDGPVRALLDLRESGVVGHVGVAGGPSAMLERFVRTGLFEAAVTHNRFTLLDRSSDGLLDACAELGVGVFNAAPFGGGFLSGGGVAAGFAGRVGPPSDTAPRYAYRTAAPDHLAAAARMRAACLRYGVTLRSAALQFSLRDPRVTSTIVGASRPEQVADVLHDAATPIPEELWAELEELVPPRSAWLGPDGR